MLQSANFDGQQPGGSKDALVKIHDRGDNTRIDVEHNFSVANKIDVLCLPFHRKALIVAEIQVQI